MTIFIMIVATLNLMLGYWLGVCAHHDAQDSLPTYPDIPLSAIVAAPSALAPSRLAQPQPATAAAPPAETTAPLEAPTVPSAAPTAAPAEPITQPAEEANPAPQDAADREPPLVAEMAIELTSYRGQLVDFDSRVRASAAAPDRAQAESLLSEFKATSEEYLAQQERAAASLNQLGEDDPARVQLHTELQHALDTQRNQVEQATEHLEEIDLESDLATGFQQLLAETAKVIESNYVLGDKLSRASQGIAVAVDAQDADVAQDRQSLVDRDRFEAALESWRRDQQGAGRSLTLALVEIDRFPELNQTHGIAVGDALLQATSGLIARSLRAGDLATRYSGAKFLVMLPDTSVEDSTSTVERLRQTIAASQFVHEEQPIAVTVSCAVAEAEPSDTLFTMLDRVELTLQESRRYGSNCTYMFEQNHASPVTPPSFDLTAGTLVV